MAVTVTPDTFSLVSYDAATMAGIAADVLTRLGLEDRELRIAVDETTPLARITAVVDDAGDITVEADSGAFENTRHPRQLGEEAVRTALGRVLIRVRDRLDGTFGEAPPDSELTLAHGAAWDAYAVGRLGRAGVAVHRPRWLYNFRNRHGFNDAADAAFDRLWEAERATWPELASISGGALTAAAASA